MKYLTKTFLLLLCFFLSLSLFAQDRTQAFSVALLKENTPTAFKNMINPFQQPYYFGAAVSYERGRQKSNFYSFHHVFQLGYYHHRHLHQNLFLMWKPKFQWTIANKFNFKLFPGLGYSHTFPTQPTYQLEGGKYVEKTNFGKSHAIASAGFGIGYNLTPSSEVFLHSEAMVTFPYAPNGSIPLYVSSIFLLGIKLNLKK